jgi:hypothetical protein
MLRLKGSSWVAEFTWVFGVRDFGGEGVKLLSGAVSVFVTDEYGVSVGGASSGGSDRTGDVYTKKRSANPSISVSHDRSMGPSSAFSFSSSELTLSICVHALSPCPGSSGEFFVRVEAMVEEA